MAGGRLWRIVAAATLVKKKKKKAGDGGGGGEWRRPAAGRWAAVGNKRHGDRRPTVKWATDAAARRSPRAVAPVFSLGLERSGGAGIRPELGVGVRYEGGRHGRLLKSPAGQPPKDRKTSASPTLTPTSKSSWLSPSGVIAFGFYQRGNGYYVGVFLPGTSNKTAVWTYGRDNPPLPSNSTLRFDSSGKLVLQSAQAQDAYVATPIGTTASASMLDSGNFVLYDSNQDIIWQSFDTPTDTILGGQTLSADQKLHSSASVTDPSTGLFLAIMQSDGVLALYPDGTPFYC
ncbi:hypothetical protein NL676_019644 [Syzygium grande]|nr:hypothetical protein NL676_019644 [Syzygium grande]